MTAGWCHEETYAVQRKTRVAVGARVSPRAPRPDPYVQLSRIRLLPRVCDGTSCRIRSSAFDTRAWLGFRDSCRFWNTSRGKLLQSDPLVNEQPALSADAAAISGKTSISADDPVARNHNGNRVCGIGQANRTDGFRTAQLSRQRPIT